MAGSADAATLKETLLSPVYTQLRLGGKRLNHKTLNRKTAAVTAALTGP
jgi:hypothetical protein